MDLSAGGGIDSSPKEIFSFRSRIELMFGNALAANITVLAAAAFFALMLRNTAGFSWALLKVTSFG